MPRTKDTVSRETDADLLSLYAEGDQSAARELTARLVPKIHGLAWRMLGDRSEAEDVTQEAMLRLWQISGEWKDQGAQVSTWLYRVAGNLCIDRLRKRRNAGSDQLDELADETPGVVRRLQDRDRAKALQSALATLPERQRFAIVLRHFEERSNPEIAAAMDISIEAVESLLSRARRTLAARLIPQRAELGLAGGVE